MSQTRQSIEQYNNFYTNIRCVLNLCDEKINKWYLKSNILINKDHSIYISMVKSIRDYLVTYLDKDVNDKFEIMLTDGYQKYNRYSLNDYIPTLELCKKDPLNLYDLDCATKIVNQVSYLSNDDFVKEVNKLTNGVYALTQFCINQNSAEMVENHRKDTFSNGFKYFLEGRLLEQKKKWISLFNDNRKYTKIDWGMGAVCSTLTASLLSIMYDKPTFMIAFLMTTATIAQFHGPLNDNIAVTFFSNPRRNQPASSHEIAHDEPIVSKQHITPYSVG